MRLVKLGESDWKPLSGVVDCRLLTCLIAGPRDPHKLPPLLLATPPPPPPLLSELLTFVCTDDSFFLSGDCLSFADFFGCFLVFVGVVLVLKVFWALDGFLFDSILLFTLDLIGFDWIVF